MHSKLQLMYEVLIALLAIASVYLAFEGGGAQAALVSNVIWALFAVDYFVRLMRASDKRQFVGHHLIDLIAILPMPELRIARAFRLARLLRLFRGVHFLIRSTRTLQGIFDTNNLSQVCLFTVVVMVAGAYAIAYFEPGIESVRDGLWWSLVTCTTVGYGDISPTTTEGRAVAAVLMLVGIGTLGMVTGAIATYFIRPQVSQNKPLAQIQALLHQWEQLAVEERRGVGRMLVALAEEDKKSEPRA